MDKSDDDELAGLTGQERVEAVLAEEGVPAERALAVLMDVLAGRHVDVELRKRGRKPAFSPGNERPNALNAVCDALYEARTRNEQAYNAQASDGKEKDPSIDDGTFIDGMIAGDLANVQRVLFRLIIDAQFAAERAEGLDREDGEPPPYMRLVRD